MALFLILAVQLIVRPATLHLRVGEDEFVRLSGPPSIMLERTDCQRYPVSTSIALLAPGWAGGQRVEHVKAKNPGRCTAHFLGAGEEGPRGSLTVIVEP
jgi:hypothetical protein